MLQKIDHTRKDGYNINGAVKDEKYREGTADMEEVRLNKYLAECGICSRRDADKLIAEGRVRVNGEVAVSGQKVHPTDKVFLNGKPVGGQNKKVVLRYYKPVGVTCTERDPHAKYKITDVINYPVRVTYAGRLDKDSEGLLVLTNDGELIERMMRGANRHEKEYKVKVDREITPDFLNRMAKGIYLKELDVTTRECQIEQTGKFTFQIVLTQGVNRQIRRMCETLGYKVLNLKRTRIMNLTLQGLQAGQFEEVSGEELEQLYHLAGLEK